MQESTEVEKNAVDSSLDDQPSGNEVVDAAPQSSVTEECMEVDEDVLQEKESLATDLEQVYLDNSDKLLLRKKLCLLNILSGCRSTS